MYIISYNYKFINKLDLNFTDKVCFISILSHLILLNFLKIYESLMFYLINYYFYT